MATNNQNQKSEEPEPFLMPSPKQEKDVITIMGVQGLSHNDFSTLELKIMLQLIKISQKLIDYNIRLRINRETFHLYSGTSCSRSYRPLHKALRV